MKTTQASTPFAQLNALNLGDTITLPDARELTVRAIERALVEPVGSMTGWLLAGEYGPTCALVSTPSSPGGPVVIYSPARNIPSSARGALPRCEGVVSYWAPHLPNTSGAMGELSYRVCQVRGKVDPLVLVWRGREMAVFVKSATATAEEMRYWFLRRDAAQTERHVERYSSLVVTPNTTRPATVPAQTPAAEPAPARAFPNPFRRR